MTIYYDWQCPYIYQSLQQVERYCSENALPVSFRLVDTLEKAKNLPCVFNNYGVFYQGRFQTVNLLDSAAVKRILRR